MKTLLRKLKNYFLIKRYPFLALEGEPTYVEFTILDSMPEGGRKTFGLKMCKEIRSALVSYKKLYPDIMNSYKVIQVKEKYGELRGYSSSMPGELYDTIEDIVEKYTKLSRRICIDCGKPATQYSTGGISPYCDDCANDKLEKYVPIDEFLDSK